MLIPFSGPLPSRCLVRQTLALLKDQHLKSLNLPRFSRSLLFADTPLAMMPMVLFSRPPSTSSTPGTRLINLKCYSRSSLPAQAGKGSTRSREQQELFFFALTTQSVVPMSLAIWCPPSSLSPSQAPRPQLSKSSTHLRLLPTSLNQSPRPQSFSMPADLRLLPISLDLASSLSPKAFELTPPKAHSTTAWLSCLQASCFCIPRTLPLKR